MFQTAGSAMHAKAACSSLLCGWLPREEAPPRDHLRALSEKTSLHASIPSLNLLKALKGKGHRHLELGSTATWEPVPFFSALAGGCPKEVLFPSGVS